MADEIRFEDRMSDADALTWNVESDPILRSTISGVYVLDQSPDPERFATKVERATRRIPRLRQRVVADPLGIAPPRWEFDPHFDLDFHVRELPAPGDGSLRALLDYTQKTAQHAFDKDRPLWTLTLVHGLEGGKAGLVMKLHHAVSDGVGMVKMTGSLMETFRTPDPSRKPRDLPVPTGPVLGRLESTREAIRHRRAEARSAVGNLLKSLGEGVADVVRRPVESAKEGRELVGSVGRFLQPISEPMSPLFRERSMSARFDVASVPLADLKRAAKSVGGTVNDAFVAAIGGGLRQYHAEMGESVESLRMTMPINVRSGDNEALAGNQFVPARFEVPVGIRNPGLRMKRIGELVRKQRDEPSLGIFDTVARVLNRLPSALTTELFGSMLKSIDFVTSNVPGPQFEVFVSGAKIERMFGFGPLAGAAVNVTAFSYDGDLAIGINMDPAAVSDPGLLVQCIRKSLDEVLSISDEDVVAALEATEEPEAA